MCLTITMRVVIPYLISIYTLTLNVKDIHFLVFFDKWGRSSAGRTPHWQCGGHGFEPRRLQINYL